MKIERLLECLTLAIALTVLPSLATAAPTSKAIDSGAGVLLNDYDGHAHRTAPKRVGENLGLWCESTTSSRQVITVRVFYEARELATKTVACPNDLGYRRHTRIIRVRHAGIYGMVLSGAGFDSFVIRTRVLPPDR